MLKGSSLNIPFRRDGKVCAAMEIWANLCCRTTPESFLNRKFVKSYDFHLIKVAFINLFLLSFGLVFNGSFRGWKSFLWIIECEAAQAGRQAPERERRRSLSSEVHLCNNGWLVSRRMGPGRGEVVCHSGLLSHVRCCCCWTRANIIVNSGEDVMTECLTKSW